MNTKTTARDFFLHLGAMVSFYASVVALITLLFEVINFAYPRVTDAYMYAFPSISFQVATLIVALPIFLLISRVLEKMYITDPSLREATLRRLLGYITIFLAGAIVAGDLITVIYMYLDGQELTTGFMLKILTLIVISGGVFAYYLREIKNLIQSTERNVWRVGALIVTVASIVVGFMVIGSPADQRAYRYDAKKITDLQGIQWQVINHFQMKGVLPGALADLEDSLSYQKLPVDSQTGKAYDYKSTGTLTFELCADFNRETRKGIPVNSGIDIASISAKPVYYNGGVGENWDHKSGQECFSRTIDPVLYPVVKK